MSGIPLLFVFKLGYELRIKLFLLIVVVGMIPPVHFFFILTEDRDLYGYDGVVMGTQTSK